MGSPLLEEGDSVVTDRLTAKSCWPQLVYPDFDDCLWKAVQVERASRKLALRVFFQFVHCDGFMGLRL
jgi:hypothetical protein